MASRTNKRIADTLDRARFAFRSVRLKPVEALSLAATLLFAIAVGYLYFFEVRARQSELDGFEARDRAAHSRLLEAASEKKKLEAQRSNASLIIESIGDFERRLQTRQEGTPAIINEVNGLSLQHRAVASDYSYKVIEGEGDNPANPSASSRADESDLKAYTALGIDTNVMGDYRDLRRLISAIERSRQFIVINSVTFQGEAERPGRTPVAAGMPAVVPAQVGPPASAPVSTGGGAPVSLKLEMETYFRNDLGRK